MTLLEVAPTIGVSAPTLDCHLPAPLHDVISAKGEHGVNVRT